MDSSPSPSLALSFACPAVSPRGQGEHPRSVPRRTHSSFYRPHYTLKYLSPSSSCLLFSAHPLPLFLVGDVVALYSLARKSSKQSASCLISRGWVRPGTITCWCQGRAEGPRWWSEYWDGQAHAQPQVKGINKRSHSTSPSDLIKCGHSPGIH